MAVSLNEFVSRAIVQSLVHRREEILAGVRDDMVRYSEHLRARGRSTRGSAGKFLPDGAGR